MKCRECGGTGVETDENGILHDDICEWCEGTGKDPFPEDFYFDDDIEIENESF